MTMLPPLEWVTKYHLRGIQKGRVMETSLVKQTPLQEDIAKLLEQYKDGETEEENAIRVVLAEMLEGTKVVTLNALVVRGGFDGNSQPKVAVAPALTPHVFFEARRRREDPRVFSDRFRNMPPVEKVHIYAEGFDLDLTDEHVYGFPRVMDATYETRGTGFHHHRISVTRTPLIPPRVVNKHDLSNKLVGFEVSEWTTLRNETEEIPKLPPPRPRDPVLLEHLVGEMYRVVDSWELTDLELTVLAALRNVK